MCSNCNSFYYFAILLLLFHCQKKVVKKCSLAVTGMVAFQNIFACTFASPP